MSSLMIALEITALGMGLVFAAIILLWWIMVLLTWITAEKESAAPPLSPPTLVEMQGGTMPGSRLSRLPSRSRSRRWKTLIHCPTLQPPLFLHGSWACVHNSYIKKGNGSTANRAR